MILALTILAATANARQSQFSYSSEQSSTEVPRFELGVAFSGIHLSDNNNFGVTARSVFNLNSFFSLEGEGTFYLNDAKPKILSGGRAVQGLFGPKIGIRSDNWGIFAKVRPGVISFPNAIQGVTLNPTLPFSFSIQTRRLTEPALDLGTVIEFYPARHLAWRTDLGNTIIFYRDHSFLGITLPGTKQSNFQFSTGMQYRF